MNRLALLIALLIPAVCQAGGFYHGQKFTHDYRGRPYRGYYYRYNAKTYQFDRYDIPIQNTTNSSVSYSYVYNYNNASANAGATQSGLYSEPVFRYDELDVGGVQYDSLKYVSAARSIDERIIDADRTRRTQSAYTRDKVHSILAAGQANAQVLKSAEAAVSGGGVPQVLQQFNSYSPGGNGYAHNGANGSQPLTAAPNGTSIDARCARCHATGAQAQGVILPPLSEFTPEQAESALLYVSRIDDRNCAKRALLTSEEQQQLVDFLKRKIFEGVQPAPQQQVQPQQAAPQHQDDPPPPPPTPGQSVSKSPVTNSLTNLRRTRP